MKKRETITKRRERHPRLEDTNPELDYTSPSLCYHFDNQSSAEKARKIIFIVTAILVLLAAAPALGHYHALVPEDYDTWRARKGEMVNLRLLWGHGYEHIWFDALKPQSIFAVTPEGKKVDLLDSLKKDRVRAASGKERASFKLNYTPSSRGDHVLCLTAARQWDAESSEWLQDYVKTVLPVQVENGWSREIGQSLEVVPLSRPYGVLPGAALRFRVLYKGEPATGVRIERELLSKTAPEPAALPSESFIAYPARTGSDGTVVFSFPSSGWYGITAIRGSGKEYEKDGHSGELIERSTLWVYVSEKPE